MFKLAYSETRKHLPIVVDAAANVKHYKEIQAILTKAGISLQARASFIGVSQQTLKQWAAKPGTASHRPIGAQELDKLRREAMDCIWSVVDRTVSSWTAREMNKEAADLAPKKWIVGHEFPGRLKYHTESYMLPRALEMADNQGGYVYGYDVRTLTSPGAVWRHEWRQLVYALKKSGVDVYALAEEYGVSRYNVGRIGIEYPDWRMSAPLDLVARMKEIIAEIEQQKQVAA